MDEPVPAPSRRPNRTGHKPTIPAELAEAVALELARLAEELRRLLEAATGHDLPSPAECDEDNEDSKEHETAENVVEDERDDTEAHEDEDDDEDDDS